MSKFTKKSVSHHELSKISSEEIKEVKTMILLKSLVFGLFIVFVTLLISFFIIKNHRLKKADNSLKCSNQSSIIIDGKIEEIKVLKEVITIITFDHSNNKKIIRIDPECGNEINHINLIIK